MNELNTTKNRRQTDKRELRFIFSNSNKNNNLLGRLLLGEMG